MTEFAHDAILAQAARQPAAPAVVDDCGTALDCAALSEAVSQLAWWLQARGAGPERVVAVDLARSSALVVAVLAVLSAGAAYLPLSPDLPADRRDFMLADADATLVITEALLDASREEIHAQPLTRPRPHLDPGNLAYIIYTSGSTGRPKGVMVEHRQLATYLRWASALYCAGRGAGALLHTPVIFDLSVTTLFVPLMAGQPVHLMPSGPPVAIALPEALRGQGYSFAKLTPAHLGLLADTLPSSALAAVTPRLVVGGEPLSYGQFRPWTEHAPATTIINEYGPTEATVACCVYELAAGGGGSGPVPIGTATPGTRLLVLGDDLCPVEAGGSGELYIGGAQVARGYLGRAGLTANRFVPDPAEPGARMYRSGDLVRRGHDGNLLFLGRRDQQVKLNGFRIELGEIEAVLVSHADVVQAAACVRGSGRSQRIAAYLVAREGARPRASDVLAYAGRRLPEYMMPSNVTFLTELPLTSGGKVDKAALPEPAPARAGSAR